MRNTLVVSFVCHLFVLIALEFFKGRKNVRSSRKLAMTLSLACYQIITIGDSSSSHSSNITSLIQTLLYHLSQNIRDLVCLYQNRRPSNLHES